MPNNTSPTLKPWRFDGTGMRPNILLMCKLLVLTLYVHNFFQYINDPFLPFIPVFEVFNEWPGLFKSILNILFVLASIFLFLNIRVRSMAIILGVVIILTMVVSKPEFKNHIFIYGCVLFLAGLTHKKNYPWFLVLQLCLVYFGASLNKMLQADWWSGAFMDYWLNDRLQNSIYITVSSWLPELWFAKFLSWSSMIIEMLIAALLLFKRKHAIAIFILVVFHTALFTLVNMRFGFFFEALVITLIAFVPWPSFQAKFSFNSTCNRFFLNLISLFKWNELVSIDTVNLESKYWLKLEYNNKFLYNVNALRYLCLFSPGFYIGLFGLDLLIRLLTNGMISYIIYITLFWSIIIFFSKMVLSKSSKLNFESNSK